MSVFQRLDNVTKCFKANKGQMYNGLRLESA
jgi:hypothetical protein